MSVYKDAQWIACAESRAKGDGRDFDKNGLGGTPEQALSDLQSEIAAEVERRRAGAAEQEEHYAVALREP